METTAAHIISTSVLFHSIPFLVLYLPNLFPLLHLVHLKNKFLCCLEEEKASQHTTIKKNMNAKCQTSRAAIIVKAAAKLLLSRLFNSENLE